MSKYYLFDGSFSGFLCVIFQSFYRKEFDVVPCTLDELSFSIIFDFVEIDQDISQSKRVWKGLEEKFSKEECMDFYRVFLSEDRKAWLVLFKLISGFFKGEKVNFQNYGDPDVLYFALVLKKVHRERYRMKAFVRFQKSEDGLYSSTVEPDFNVLPLIVDFFKNRFANQSWLIYDVKREYGYLWDQSVLLEVARMEGENENFPSTTLHFSEDEEIYQRLWKGYFKSTNIEERKNLKLHLRHVPRRYWKYLTEKL